MWGSFRPVVIVSAMALAFPARALSQTSPVLNELRIDQPGGTDPDEYFEIAGPPSASLDGLTFIAIGDSGVPGDSGTIEVVVSLAGASIPSDGFLLVSEATLTLGTPDLTASLNFENADTVTYMLVAGFTGALNQDLDTNDDGIFEAQPWQQIVDSVANLAPSSDHAYASLSRMVGPGPLGAAWHIRRCGDGTGGWSIGPDDPASGADTPGIGNGCLSDLIFAEGFDIVLTTVVDIQTGTIPPGPVTLHDVVVTARTTNNASIWIADASGPAAYNGIYVVRGVGAPPLGPEFGVGALVHVTGSAIEFDPLPPGEALTEILPHTITVVGAGFLVPLSGLSAATLSSLDLGEPYEGVLVTLTNMEVVAHGSFDRVTLQEFGGSGTIVMDDLIYDLAATAFPIGTLFTSLTGVMHVLGDERYLLPRSAADLVP